LTEQQGYAGWTDEALIGALNKLTAELGTMEDIRTIGALNDQISRMVEGNMMQCKISAFFKTI